MLMVVMVVVPSLVSLSAISWVMPTSIHFEVHGIDNMLAAFGENSNIKAEGAIKIWSSLPQTGMHPYIYCCTTAALLLLLFVSWLAAAVRIVGDFTKRHHDS